MTHCIVVGSGPVGSSTALALAKKGFRVTLLEREATLPADPRAATVQPPTLEMLDELGVTPRLLEQGLMAQEYQFRDRATSEVIATFDYGRLEGETKFPFALQCEQFKIASTVVEALRSEPQVKIRLGEEVVGLSQDADSVSVTLASGDTLTADYLVGCDGGRSFVRKSSGISFEGFTYDERFLVLTTRYDFHQHGYVVRNYSLDPAQWCSMFKVPHDGPPGLWRCVFPVAGPDAELSNDEVLSDAHVGAQMAALNHGLTEEDVLHRNVYTVNQRVAGRFRAGRVFLAGDSAHVNNPLGGLGMNSGIHDGVNLAGKIAEAVASPADADAILDRYDTERRELAKEFVQAQTIRNKKRLEARTPEARAAARRNLADSAADPELHRAWVLDASLLGSLRSLEEKGKAA
ncbi:FAD-dependent oxidoreductase [Psychromarinibacter halotolerans]|uniref:FAD-dependent oxidoreductase n=1 Tax=Psychromarinibacter halotolerans TaxID=1775175 RepID=A0ABV7GWD5_9RHOB|nr:FAD-dependent oxidoreductase [Psychromarinibacter halotolerans]MDF0596300.1 FAD-dependent oxidoreductase [Psychromarinibacter halotolerans]